MRIRKILYNLRKKEAKKISSRIVEKIGISIFGEMKKMVFDSLSIILVDDEPLIVEYDNDYYLSVYGVLKFKPKKGRVVVDEGAKKFILNGADVMRPGITYADPEIKKNEFVYVEVENSIPIAVGIALMDGSEMLIKERGKAVKNIHYVGDKIWNFLFNEGLLSNFS